MKPFFITIDTDARSNQARISSNGTFELVVRAKSYGESHKAVTISGRRKGAELFIDVETEDHTESLAFKM